MRRPQRRYQLPPLVSHPLDDLWSVVVPIARTNLVTNPSFETNTTNWAAIGGSIARSTTHQYHGAYSLAVTPVAFTDDGVQYGATTALSLTAGTAYAYSCKFRGQAGLKYELVMVSSLFVVLARKRFVATGRWQWITGVYVEGATATAYLVARKDGQANLTPFYIDGVQVEACAAGEVFPTTYIDGDQQGLVPNQFPAAYLWNGTPHGSTSSRSGLTRAGGRVVKFKNYGWFLTAIIGLGLAVPQHRITEYAALDGGNDDGTRKPTRQFTLAGQFAANTYGRLRENRGALSALLDRDLIGEDQRLKLRYQAMRGCDLVGEEAEVICKYAGGLEGNTDGHFGAAAPITFTHYLPVVLSPGEAGAALTVNQTVNDADAVVARSAGGLWAALGTGLGGGTTQARAIVRGLDGLIYVGGNFTDAGGSGADYLAAYNPATGTWSVVGSATAINGQVSALAIGPDGRLYVGGVFTNAGGVAAADSIAVWDGATWAALGTGTAGQILALAFAPDGTLYAGGNFLDIGGSGADNIASWNGSAWAVLASATALNDVVESLAYGNGLLYVGGAFLNAGGVADADRIATWNGTAWAAIGTGASSDVLALAVGLNGLVYAGGAFTTIGGVSALRVAVWNGSAWTALASGLNGNVQALSIAPDGTLYASGSFTATGTLTLLDAFARWNGSTWISADINLPGTVNVYTVRVFADGSVYVGYDTSGAATAAGLTTVDNIGTARTYPTLVMKYPSAGTTRVYQIVNITTGRAIYLNLTMNLGETVTMRFEPDNLSFVSDFVGNVANSILPGSNEADFFLQPGDNIISFFTTGGTLTATLRWQEAYLSLDDR